VGVLDADIYGPSIAMMLGVPEDQRPEVVDEKFFKACYGSWFSDYINGRISPQIRRPMVWRGPMAAGALQQLLQQTLGVSWMF
jgi:ATP-binding protein involved in chromosome partitioning